MKGFLIKLGLIDHFNVEFPTGKEALIKFLKAEVENGDVDGFVSPAEAYYKSRKPYVGYLTEKGFKIRLKRRFFKLINTAVAHGSFKQSNNAFSVDIVVKGYTEGIGPFLLVFLPLFLLVSSFSLALPN